MSKIENLNLKNDSYFKLWELSTKNDEFKFNLEIKEKIWNLFKQESSGIFIQLKEEMKTILENMNKKSKNNEKEIEEKEIEIERKIFEFSLSIYSILEKEFKKEKYKKKRNRDENEKGEEEETTQLSKRLKIKNDENENGNMTINKEKKENELYKEKERGNKRRNSFEKNSNEKELKENNEHNYFILPNDMWREIFRIIIKNGESLDYIRLSCKLFRNLTSPYWKQAIPISHLYMYFMNIKKYGLEVNEIEIRNCEYDILKEIPSSVTKLKISNKIRGKDLKYISSIIQYLDISESNLINELDLAHLSPNLKKLNLYGCKNITLNNLTRLRNMNIEVTMNKINEYRTPLFIF